MKKLSLLLVLALVVAGVLAVRRQTVHARSQPAGQAAAMSSTSSMTSMPGMPGMPDMAGEEGASHAMGTAHVHMGNHMKMTAKRPPTPEDLQKAAAIVSTLRATLEPYRDYRVAIKDGYRPFLPDVALPQYHFTNYWRGFGAAIRFDPTQPTSLLYRKTSDGYELLGAMYTAPRRMSEDTLNDRVPLSVAQWHAHVNICLPPRSEGRAADWTTFGFAGSISTVEACKAAGGRFEPQLFGWMVHVYPFETTPEAIWTH